MTAAPLHQALFGREWPNRPLYDLMLNSTMGHERAVETIVWSIGVFGDTDAKGLARPERYSC
jgi:hypothetical protein